MKTIIAGSRSINDMTLVEAAVLLSGFKITEVVSGGAKGIDTLGEKWAINNDIKVTIFPAKWDEYGKRAGFIRNKEMADYAKALIAIWDGKSRGTKHMIDLAKSHNLKVFILKI